MATHLLKKLLASAAGASIATTHRSKTTSSQYVASRARDATFEKLMDKIQTPPQSNRHPTPHPLKPTSLHPLLHFCRFLQPPLPNSPPQPRRPRRYPHIFYLFHDPLMSTTFCKLTPQATHNVDQETSAIAASLPLVINRLVRLLWMSSSKRLPLRAIFKVWKELGLPDDFEDSVILRNPDIFRLLDGHEPNTHVLELVDGNGKDCGFSTAVENWRVMECCKEDASVDRTEIRFSFKQGFLPGMRLKKNFRAKDNELQKIQYVGPYDEMGEKKVKMSKSAMMGLEKRGVAIVHEFLSLTVEKMVEVEKISHFRKWFGIDLNIRDLFLDHPGIFYLSTKGKRHTVFLREAYERGCLIDPNPVYDARRKLLDLVVLGRRGMNSGDYKITSVDEEEGNGSAEAESD